jgi:hypothetical protein
MQEAGKGCGQPVCEVMAHLSRSAVRQ